MCTCTLQNSNRTWAYLNKEETVRHHRLTVRAVVLAGWIAGAAATATLIRIGKLETPVVVLNPTVFRRKSPLAVDTVNTGIADGALTALSRMSRRARPPAA